MIFESDGAGALSMVENYFLDSPSDINLRRDQGRIHAWLVMIKCECSCLSV